jgi:HSP20 family protein
LRYTASPAFAKLPERPSIIAMRAGSGAACTAVLTRASPYEADSRLIIGNFKSLENKNAAPNLAAWLLHGAATSTLYQELPMFVLPLARTSHRAAAPQFNRFIDHLLDESAERTVARTPALDVSETDAGYIVAFDVPGVTREQLKVSVEGRRVSVESVDLPEAAPDTDATKAADEPKAAAPRVLYRERAAARYSRTVSLPAEVDQAASTAKFDNGVLTLTLAKKVPTGAMQISVG